MLYRRIVIKIGTKVLTSEDGTLDLDMLENLVKQIADAKKAGMEVVLVSSGAVAAGRSLVDFNSRTSKMAERQVFAAIGQVKLMSTYAALFAAEGLVCAQVLATKEDFRDRNHYLNMRNCFENLLSSGVVPVVNENDTVATTELLFTDNDELTGLVASQLGAEAVIILTSAPGFFLGDPYAENSPVIPEIDFDKANAFEKYILPDKTMLGRGGMLTKFNIMRKLALSGIVVHLAGGREENVIRDIVSGISVGTRLLSSRKSSSIKRRIAYSEGLAKGSVWVNCCAEELLRSSEKIASLLPVGVTAVRGEFVKGDIIEIYGPKQKLGYGIAEYGAERVRELLGKNNSRPVVHYDHMFIEVT
jgi:glutamate 5-kinase